MSDAMHMKSLQPGYRRFNRQQRKRLIDAALHLAFVVRENIGRKCKRGDLPSPATKRLDRIRDALTKLDDIRKEGK